MASRAVHARLVLAFLPWLAGCQESVVINTTGNGPMCARYEVVEFVSQEIVRRAPYDTLVLDSIGERPTMNPAVVNCVAGVVNRNYDYTRYWQQTWQGYQEYSVRRLTNGYEVDVVPRLASTRW